MSSKTKITIAAVLIVLMKIMDFTFYYVPELLFRFNLDMTVTLVTVVVCLLLFYYIVDLRKKGGKPINKWVEYGCVFVILQPCLYMTLGILFSSLYYAHTTGWTVYGY